MTKQERTILQILYRHEKGAYSQMERTIPVNRMEPQVRRVFEAKKAAVAELERRLKSGSG